MLVLLLLLGQKFWPGSVSAANISCCTLVWQRLSDVLTLHIWISTVISHSLWLVLLDTGAHCEVDLSHNCSRDTCVGGSRCVPLIRGGFRCELCRGTISGRHAAPSSCAECDSIDHRSPFCELRSRGFPHRGSFLMFPPLKQRHRFNIKLRSGRVSCVVYRHSL